MYATDEQLTGFPPTFIVINELNFLRDQNARMYRRLSKLGVKVQGADLLRGRLLALMTEKIFS